MTNALRGQFEIELPDATVVPVLLNMYAVNTWCEETGKSLEELDKALNDQLLQSLPGLTWAGVRAHFELAEEELPITEKRFKILLGSANWETVATKMAQALNLDPQVAEAAKKKGK